MKKHKRLKIEWYHNKTYSFNNRNDLISFMYKNKFDNYYIVGGFDDNLIYCRFGKKISFLKKLLTKKRI